MQQGGATYIRRDCPPRLRCAFGLSQPHDAFFPSPCLVRFFHRTGALGIAPFGGLILDRGSAASQRHRPCLPLPVASARCGWSTPDRLQIRLGYQAFAPGRIRTPAGAALPPPSGRLDPPLGFSPLRPPYPDVGPSLLAPPLTGLGPACRHEARVSATPRRRPDRPSEYRSARI